MLERKKVVLKRRTHHFLYKMLQEVFSLWEQGYRLPDPKETREKGDWPRIGLGGRDQITLIREVPDVVETPKDEVSEGEEVSLDIDALKVKYKELTGKGTNMKDPEKLLSKIKEIEASEA